MWRTFPYDVGGVKDIGRTLRAYAYPWGTATVHLTDDSAYDEGGYIVLVDKNTGTTYTVPGFLKRASAQAVVFHADTSYVQMIPWAVLRDVELVYP